MRIFGKLQDGYLIIDDTVISKRFAKKIEKLSWVFCSKLGKVIQGFNIVVLAWSNGKITIPLAIRVYQKVNGKTKIDLALELIEYAKSLDLKPKYITFDCWYAADKILKEIEELGWNTKPRLQTPGLCKSYRALGSVFNQKEQKD